MKTKKRVLTKQRRLDTTLSKTTLKRLGKIAKWSNQFGRRYAMSQGEAADMAIEWMNSQDPVPGQVPGDGEKDIRIGLILAESSVAKLKRLAVKLRKSPGYVRPYRSRELSLGATLDWCVSHYCSHVFPDERGKTNDQSNRQQ